MEDASGMDLDWFWRGWFYSTDYSDIGIKEVKTLYITDKQTDRVKELIKTNPRAKSYFESLGDLVFLTDKKEDANSDKINSYINSLPANQKATLKALPKYTYQVEFEKPGGLPMPIIVELTYVDGSKKRETYPAQIWMKNDNKAYKVFNTNKEIKSIVVDPDLETADIDTTNNSWPKKTANKFDKFKSQAKN